MTPDQLSTLTGNLTNVIWYLVLTFWTISGALSTLASMLPPPPKLAQSDANIAHGGNTKTTLKAQGFLDSWLYTMIYRLVNIGAQNLLWARRLNDPKVHAVVGTVVKAFLAVITAGMMKSALTDGGKADASAVSNIPPVDPPSTAQ